MLPVRASGLSPDCTSQPSHSLMQAPSSSILTGVSATRLILGEATRLLARFWKVSPPTDCQCTLLCEQVGGGTWRQRLQAAAGAGPRHLCV